MGPRIPNSMVRLPLSVNSILAEPGARRARQLQPLVRRRVSPSLPLGDTHCGIREQRIELPASIRAEVDVLGAQLV